MLLVKEQPEAEWNQNSVIPNLNTSVRKVSAHTRSKDNGLECLKNASPPPRCTVVTKYLPPFRVLFL